MFLYAYSFNQNLCSWSQYVTSATEVTDMFLDSNCKYNTPPTFDWAPGGPFCYDCPRPGSLPSITEGPYELPIVPAAITQRPDNTIVAWAGDMPYEFDTDAVYTTAGTFTSTFNPTTKATTILRVERTLMRRSAVYGQNDFGFSHPARYFSFSLACPAACEQTRTIACSVQELRHWRMGGS
jgi:hypothetical protein